MIDALVKRLTPRAYLGIALVVQLAFGTLAGARDYLLILEARPRNVTPIGWLALVGAHVMMARTYSAGARDDRGGDPRYPLARGARISLLAGIVAGATLGFFVGFLLSMKPGILYRGHWSFG